MSTVPIVCLGSMEFGRYATAEQGLSMTQLFIDAGHHEIDTALMYANGVTQEIIGDMINQHPKLKSVLIIHTKVNPWGEHKLTRQSINQQVDESLKALKLERSTTNPPIDILYLHAPDHETPILETLQTMNELYKSGVYRRFGLSNYAAWQVAQIHGLCNQHSLIPPTVYQGMYNALTLGVEPELFPCLRTHKMCFYAYNPLAGGILTGKYQSINDTSEGNRFANNDWAAAYRARYWREDIFKALDKIREVLSKEPDTPTMTEASLRWMMHHSKLKGELGDAVIIGASKEQHVAQNLEALTKGPLSVDVVNAFAECAELCKAQQPSYFR